MDALDRISLPTGALLFAEGDPGFSAYLINSGGVEIFLTRDGQEVSLATRGPGEIVGEMAIIDNLPRSASCRAIAESELVLITSEQLIYRIEDTDPILRMCLGVVLQRYRDTIAMLDGSNTRRLAAKYERVPSKEGFQAALKTLSLESELRRAIQKNELELFFQPIVELPTRRLSGFECLLRWRHPERGLVSPAEFIPVAEASGLISEITAWCIGQVGTIFPVIQKAARQHVEGAEPLFATINISGHDLAKTSFVDALATMLGTSGIAPRSIKLEVTESVLMKDPQKAATTLDACRRLGLGVAIDDFGSGYSSLSYLSTLPITTIKIDQSFVRSMKQKASSKKIIKMILGLADELGIPVVAEGIEEVQEERLVAGLACAFGQGYLFGRPLPLAETLAFTRLKMSLEQAATIIAGPKAIETVPIRHPRRTK